MANQIYKTVFFLSACLLIVSVAGAAVIHVPGDQLTIQAGLDVAAAGDTVLCPTGRLP